MYKMAKKLGTLPNNMWVISKYLSEFCQYKTTCKLNRYYVSVASMLCKFHDTKYLISTGNHIFYVENGVIYDSYDKDSRTNRMHKVEYLLSQFVQFIVCDSEMFSTLAKELCEMTEKEFITEDKFLLNKDEDSHSMLTPIY